MELELADLKKRKAELEQKLSDPEILRDGQRVKALAIELGRIGKELAREAQPVTSGGDPYRLIIEIRAGTGGEEAALFAGELLKMYAAYAKRRGWEVTLIDSHLASLGGYKEVIFEISGKDAFLLLQREAGVHRVQRIPDTEKVGRIHTSTASVAVLPEAKESDIEIKPQDIKIEFFRSSGPGGQNVNKVETAVRISHLPSGLVVASQESRSQQKNREQAMMLLRTKLLAARREADQAKTAASRREQIGSAERAEKIRTYNFPQDRITDHRIKKSWHNIEEILAGNLDPIVEAFGESQGR